MNQRALGYADDNGGGSLSFSNIKEDRMLVMSHYSSTHTNHISFSPPIPFLPLPILVKMIFGKSSTIVAGSILFGFVHQAVAASFPSGVVTYWGQVCIVPTV